METDKSSNFKDIGNGFLETSKYQMAIEYFSKAIDAIPEDAEAYDLRAIVWFRLLEIENAINDLETALQVDPEYHIAFSHLGEIAIAKNNYEQAELYYSKALEIFPDNLVYLSNLALVKLNLKKDLECLEVCNNILKDYPSDKWALDCRGSVYLNQKKYSESIQDYIKLSHEDRDNAVVYNNIGYAYSKLGVIDKAKNNLNLCIRLKPDFAYAHDNLGYVYYLENNFQKALELINTSINLDPSNSYAFKNRALVYLKQNKLLQAADDLKLATELGFTKDYGDEVEKLLESLNTIK